MSGRILPWSESCFVCGHANRIGLGVRFTVDEAGTVRVETTLEPAFEGYPGHVHGGVVSALLDETIGWACSVASHRLFYTVELRVRFVRAVPGGVPVVARGVADEVGRRLARGHGAIEDLDGRELASASGLYLPLPLEAENEVLHRLKMPGRPATADDI